MMKSALQDRCCILAVLIFSFLMAGCSTLKVHLFEHEIVHPFVGTKTAVRQFGNSFTDFDYYGEQFLWAVDIPMCMVADTLLLPYDLYVSLGPVNTNLIATAKTLFLSSKAEGARCSWVYISD
ncbi:MAG: YceK/YidQ family lipoprotein [Candidatus Thiodiazotropha sp. (ex Dulcina madagascariensis)]|nr:YceK/YidQ family lipoprotein [Candidatus Thiodiazotropha sp. (ex Dulcina madagascariensis)]